MQESSHVTRLRSALKSILTKRLASGASGHVAAAFSAAFAMRLAAPRRQAFAGALLALAVLVWLNTIYSRYHYAADGLAAVTMTTATMGILSAYRRRQARMTSPANTTTVRADTGAKETALTQSNPQ
jgi:membrane-associated phospholipid phosphatase